MSAPEHPARPRRARRAARALLAALACLLAGTAALVALAAALSHGVQRDRVRGLVQRALSRALGAQVELRELHGPLYPELELRGLSLRTAQGEQLRAERIRIACAALCGWREGRLELAALELSGLQLDLQASSAAPASQEPAGPPLPVHIRVLQLQRVQLALPALRWPVPPSPALGAHASAPTVAPPAAAPTRIELAGELRGVRLDARGAQLPESGALDWSAGPLELSGRQIARAGGRLQLAGGALRAEPLELQSDAGVLRSGSLRAELHPDAGMPGGANVVALELRAALEQLDAGAWSGLPALRSALAGSVELRARAGANGWAQPEVDLQAQLRGPAAGAPLDLLELRARAQGERWELQRARWSGAALQLDASGSGDAAGVHALELQGEVARLDELWPAALAPWLGGNRASVRARVSGSWRELAGSASLHAQELRLGAGRPGALQARLRASAGRFELEELLYRSAPARRGGAAEIVRARGSLAPDGQLELRAELQALELGRLPAALRPQGELGGAVSGWLELGGSRARPELRTELRATRLRAGPLPESGAELELVAAGERAEGRFALDPAGPAALSGRFALPYAPGPPWPEPSALFHRSGASLELRAQALAIQELLALAGADPATASGALGGELRAVGEPGGPRIAGRLQLSAVSARSASALGPADGELRFEQLAPWHPAGPRLRITGELAVARGEQRWPLELALQMHHWLDWPRLEFQIDRLEAARGDQRLQISGALGSGLHAEPLRVRVQRLELAPWLPQQPQPLSGRLDAQIEIHGPLLEGPAVSGALALAEPRYGEARGERLAVEFGTHGERFLARGHLEALGTLAARASLELPGPLGARSLDELLADPASRLELRSESLDLRWLEPLAPAWLTQLQGALSADLRVSGAPRELELAGQLALADASAQVPLLGQRVGPLQASAHLENRALVLDELHIQAEGGGLLQARGLLALERTQPTGEPGEPSGERSRTQPTDERSGGLRPGALSLRARLADFPISSSAVASFAATGAVELNGPLQALEFSGDLSVREGRFAAPERSDPLWKEIRVLQASAPAEQFREGTAAITPFDTARGRLRITIPEDTWLRGRGAELEVTGEVELRKERGEPLRYFGGLETRRGSYQLGRQRLLVERGSLQFGGSEHLDPLLDVLAAAELREHRVEVLLRGPLSEPTSELRSDPPLPRDEVLALLLFGIPTAELEQDRAAALSSVLALLGSELAVNDLRTRVARVMPFDTLGVQTDAEGTGTRLEVGRYVGKGIFVSYGRSVTGPTPEDAVGLEWRLTPSFSLKSETSSEGHTGADLIWRKDY